MTDANRSHITLVCDRSGSMGQIRDDAEGAVNHFLDEQRKVDRPCTLRLVEFNAPSGIIRQVMVEGMDLAWLQGWYHVVHEGNLTDAPRYVLNPSGSTALLDATAQAIRETGMQLAAMPEAERPGNVFFVVQTDGQENSSKETTWEHLNALVAEHENTWKWTFIWLGTGPDTWGQFARHMHGTRSLDNIVRTGAGGQSMSAGYDNVSYMVSEARVGNVADTYGAHVDDAGNVTRDKNEEGSTEVSHSADDPSPSA